MFSVSPLEGCLAPPVSYVFFFFVCLLCCFFCVFCFLHAFNVFIFLEYSRYTHCTSLFRWLLCCCYVHVFYWVLFLLFSGLCLASSCVWFLIVFFFMLPFMCCFKICFCVCGELFASQMAQNKSGFMHMSHRNRTKRNQKLSSTILCGF